MEVREDERSDITRGSVSEPRDYTDFYREAWPKLMRLAFARVGEAGRAEDLVQDVLADAHRRWPELAGYDDPLAWARRAVLNRSISRWRRAGSERRALAIVGTGDAESADPSDLVEHDPVLWVAIRSLPDRQRDVALLLWFEDLPAGAVAVILGCSEDTVRTHWRRARSRLTEMLSNQEGEARS